MASEAYFSRRLDFCMGVCYSTGVRLGWRRFFSDLRLFRKERGQGMEGRDNILGTMPMGRLVLHMSWPIMVSMLLQAVYNLVDSLYVSRLGDAAFLALSYAYPIQTLMVAFCVGTGVGFSAVLSRCLGRKDIRGAGDAVLHGLLLYLACWVLFLAFALTGCRAYMNFCTDAPDVAAMGGEYLRICCGASLGMCLMFPLERVLQSCGHPAGFMLIQGSGAVINLVLDPVLIFALGMGVRGAAIATVTGQLVAAGIGFGLLWGIRREMPVSLRGFRLRPELIRDMGVTAVPAIAMQALSSVMSLGLNAIFRIWSETAVWVMGVYFKVQSFVFMPIFSISNGLIAVVSFNHGARNRERVSAALGTGLLFAVGAALLGQGLLSLVADPLLRWGFVAGPEALALGVPALRLTALGFAPAAASIIGCSALQSLGRGGQSLGVALLRQAVFVLPAARLLLPLRSPLVFLALPVAEVLACVVAAWVCLRLKRERIDTIRPLEGEQRKT